jgi:ATP-dependent Lhr-like helicase
MALDLFHPVLAAWFRERFGAPTDAQALAWPQIAAGRDTLISAPTGSGKTLAAFFWCLDGLLRRAFAGGEIENRTQILYVSPLKALSNDVHRNLEEPLAEIRALAETRGLSPPAIRVAVRSGDTPAAERRRMASKPPHILVTTPESLYILLTSESGRRALEGVRTAIIDEIHAVMPDKRGAHLALSLERLERLVAQAGGPRPVRIGLSATQSPIEEVGRFLVGARRVDAAGRPDCRIVDAGRRRDLDLGVEVPQDELGAVASNGMWSEVYDRIAALIAEYRTTIVFVNTRRLVERVGHQIAARVGEGVVAVHHGSLARKTRLEAERRLKHGEIRAIVATASLELGIDVGAVDLVCQIGSPRAIRTLLQRVGRSGHRLSATPRGRLFALTRDQLLECAALVRAARAGTIDRLAVRRRPLDILAQQMVAVAACEDLAEAELFDLCRSAYPYAGLEPQEFEDVLRMLADGVATRRGRSGAYLHRDRVHGRVRGRRGARIAAITAGGAIPDVADYEVVAEPEGTFVGKLDEDFAVESMAGDIFLLGNTSWRILRVESGRVRVADAGGAPPTIPFWKAEAPSRTAELSEAVSELRGELELRLERGEEAVEWLSREASVARPGAEQAVAYVAATRRALGAVPTQRRVIAERFFDESGGMQLVLHAPFGGRVNRAWGLALRKRFCRTFDFELQAAATDDGILLSLGPQHSFPLEGVFRFLQPGSARAVLAQAVLAAPMFGTRWRWNATRSLAVLRSRGGKKVPPPLQRFRAEDMLAAVFPAALACGENHDAGDIEIPSHPLVDETLRDCFEEAMDLEGLREVLSRIADGAIELLARDTPEPSPMCHEILNANPYAYLDDAPLEERRARAVSVRRGLPEEVAQTLGALDPEAIALVAADAWPPARDPDELHDALLTLCVLPERDAAQWAQHADSLIAAGRAAWLGHSRGRALVPAERVAIARAAWPAGRLHPNIPAAPGSAALVEDGEAHVAIVRGWLSSIGPTTARELADRLGIALEAIERGLARVEAEGQVLRGTFRAAARSSTSEPQLEWCDRVLLARIHRLTIGRLRREIEPVATSTLVRFLLRWQHLAPHTQLHGEEGLLRVIGQLQGFEAGAAAWEPELLRPRVADYRPSWLDSLCLSGEVAWGRLARREAPRPVARAARAALRAAAPIGIVRRDDLSWLLATGDPATEDGLSHAAGDVIAHLAARGASFLPEIVEGTGRLRAEVEDALREVVATGLATADGFQALRTLLARPSKRTRGHPVGPRARSPQGRWSLLPRPAVAADATDRLARQLLDRYGVVFRDLLARESRAPPWRELLPVYRRLEARGELRGGRFVAGAPGEQFALPAAVEALRTARRDDARGERVRVAASDPLNLVGIILPGPRVAAGGGRAVAFLDGVPEAPTPTRPTALEGRT